MPGWLPLLPFLLKWWGLGSPSKPVGWDTLAFSFISGTLSRFQWMGWAWKIFRNTDCTRYDWRGKKTPRDHCFPLTNWQDFRWSWLFQSVPWENLTICLFHMLPSLYDSRTLSWECLPSESTLYFFQIPQNCLIPWNGFISRISLIQAILTSCLLTRVGNHIGNNISGQKWSMAANQSGDFFLIWPMKYL